MLKTPGHAADLSSVGVMDYTPPTWPALSQMRNTFDRSVGPRGHTHERRDLLEFLSAVYRSKH